MEQQAKQRVLPWGKSLMELNGEGKVLKRRSYHFL